jgi:deazaflavin-dependent oxidoreductase (nitroreductase family)
MATADVELDDWSRTLINDMRAHGGVPSFCPFEGRKLQILTTKGAKTDKPRVAILAYRNDGDGWAIAGSKSGAPTDPAWVTNLQAHPDDITIELNNEVIPVTARIEATGAERDRLWNAHVAEMPGFADYLTKTDRVIPMVVLERRR